MPLSPLTPSPNTTNRHRQANSSSIFAYRPTHTGRRYPDPRMPTLSPPTQADAMPTANRTAFLPLTTTTLRTRASPQAPNLTHASEPPSTTTANRRTTPPRHPIEKKTSTLPPPHPTSPTHSFKLLDLPSIWSQRLISHPPPPIPSRYPPAGTLIGHPCPQRKMNDHDIESARLQPAIFFGPITNLCI